MIGNTMTAPRRQQRPIGSSFVAIAAIALACGLAATGPMVAATTEYVVLDRHTGLAIGGFDPVAYFIDASPRLGAPGIELNHGGAVWRFRSEGNRGAFAAHPEVYTPRFGGYDPVGVARGFAVPGNPQLWLIAGERLYFFYTPEARTAFGNDIEGMVTTADGKWPKVQLTLSP